MDNKELVILAGKPAGGGGGGSAENAVLYTVQSLREGQKAQARSNIGAASESTTNTLSGRVHELEQAKEKTQTVSGTTPTITPAANTIYNCDELTSLTITNPPATGAYSIVFTSGATPTVTTIPITILGLEDFAAEANTLYEINVLDNRAVVGAWEVSASE